MSPENIAHRKSQLTTAYLAHRLTRAQLGQMAQQLEAEDSVWKDSYERLTARQSKSETSEKPGEFEKTIEQLGLPERLAKLDELSVWSAEDRALYRRLSHDEQIVLKTPENRSVSLSSEDLANFKQGLADWDRNNDMRLDFSEIDFVMSGGFYGQWKESSNDPIQAASLVTLARYTDLVASSYPYDGKGVSQQDLLLLEEAPTDLLKEMNETVADALLLSKEWAETVQESKPISDELISARKIYQGVAGSCVMLSTLAGLSDTELRSLFVKTEGELTTIRFADGAEEQVASSPSLAERMYHAKGADKERWPALVEMAMAQRLYSEGSSQYGSLRAAIDGIEPEMALLALTGREADKRSLDELTINQTRDLLRDLTEGGGPVICASRPVALSDFISVEELRNGIHPGHAYTVLGFDQEKDCVTLRNPWGRGEWKFQESSDDGIFEMPTRDFYSSFRWVAGTKPKEK